MNNYTQNYTYSYTYTYIKLSVEILSREDENLV